MKTIREFNYTITVPISDIFNEINDSFCREKLKDRFVGKNYDGSHILEIRDILAFSTIKAKTCTMDVKFTAIILVLLPGDVIYGCEVFDITKKLTCVRKGNIGAYIENSVVPHKLKDKINIVVKKVVYNMNEAQTRIVVEAQSFIRSNITHINEEFKLIGESAAKESKCDFEIDQIAGMKQQLTEVDPKLLKFAKTLFDPPQSDKKLIPAENMTVGMTVSVSGSAFGKVSESTGKKSAESKAISYVRNYVIAAEIRYLQNLLGFCEYYKAADIEGEKSTWDVFNWTGEK